MKENKEWVIQHQYCNFATYLERLKSDYLQLIIKRVDDNLSRGEYMVYDMMDMTIHLVAALDEIVGKNAYPGYMVEKLSKVKSYVDTTLAYFEAKSEQLGNKDSQDNTVEGS